MDYHNKYQHAYSHINYYPTAGHKRLKENGLWAVVPTRAVQIENVTRTIKLLSRLRRFPRDVLFHHKTRLIVNIYSQLIYIQAHRTSMKVHFNL